MIVPDSVRKEWTTPPDEFEILSEDLQTIRTQIEDLQTMRAQLEETRTELSAEKMKTYQLQKRLELLEMSQAALINRIENL